MPNIFTMNKASKKVNMLLRFLSNHATTWNFQFSFAVILTNICGQLLVTDVDNDFCKEELKAPSSYMIAL